MGERTISTTSGHSERKRPRNQSALKQEIRENRLEAVTVVGYPTSALAAAREKYFELESSFASVFGDDREHPANMASSPGLDKIYDIVSISTPDGLEAALSRLERLGSSSEREFVQELKMLLDVPSTLALLLSSELMLSVLLTHFLMHNKGEFDRLQPFLERDVLKLLPCDESDYLPVDAQTYITSIAKDFLRVFAKYFATLAPPSGIDTNLYKKYNHEVPLMNIALEAVILMVKEDRPSDEFTWDAAREACNELEFTYPELDSEAEELTRDLVFALHKVVVVCQPYLSLAVHIL